MNAKKTQKYTHLFFDLDNTLTRSESPISKKMKKRLEQLSQTIVIVSGVTVEQIQKQTDGLECFMLGQNGNHAVYGEDELWHEVLKPDKVIEIMDHINSIPREWDVYDEYDLLTDKGCQISFSLYGNSAPLEEKEKFDPDRNFRKEILKKYPLISDSVEVTIAGNTQLDYTRKGRHKGHYVKRLIDDLGWDTETCLYFGDSLFEGGNDSTVIGVIETVEVNNPTDTYEKLEKFI